MKSLDIKTSMQENLHGGYSWSFCWEVEGWEREFPEHLAALLLDTPAVTGKSEEMATELYRALGEDNPIRLGSRANPFL